MNEAGKLEVYKKKLDGVCEENDLQYKLSLGGYPIYMEISPVADPDDQMVMLEAAEDKPFNSPDAKLVFTMRDGDLTYKMSQRLTIGKTLMNKLTNLFENIHRCYVQMFHRDVIERGLLRGAYVPVSTGTDSNEKLTEPLEVLEEPDEIGMDGEMPDYDEVGPDFPEEMMEEDDG